MSRRLVLAALVLVPALAAAEPPAASTAGAALALAAPAPAAELPGGPRSMTAAVVRLVLTLGVGSALLLGGVAVYRWLPAVVGPTAAGARVPPRRWFAPWVLPATGGDCITDADCIEVLARSWVGARESICLIRAGQGRFLVGVTPLRVSVLGRLDESGQPVRAARPPRSVAHDSPAPPVAPPPAVTEDSIRTALAESRRHRTRAARDRRQRDAG